MLHKEAPRPSDKHPYPSHWAKIREDALERDGRACRCCLSDESLEIHHLTYKNFGVEELGDVTTLCRPCHQSITVSVRNRRNGFSASVHEEVVKNGGTLEALTDVMQRIQDDIDRANRFIKVFNQKKEKSIKRVGDDLSQQICSLVRDCKGNCTLNYIINSAEGNHVKSQIQRRLREMVDKGALKTRSLTRQKRGRPTLVYMIAQKI